jgi:alpha-amylase
MVDNEKGNFDFLILNDIETRNPAVRAELKKWIRWYYDTVQFDGIRLDAVKHMNPAFFIEWLDYIKKEINPDLYIIGEFWLSDDLSVLLKYLDAIGNRMSLFDAPLHHNFSIASNEGADYDLRNIFHDSLLSVHPDLAITFVDNHDTQPLQSLEEYTEWWFRPLGYALILLREAGYPCVFYPDVYGSTYSGENKKGKTVEVELPVMEVLPALLQLRRDYAYGEQTDYFQHKNCIGWTRAGDQAHEGSGLAVIMSNSADGNSIKMNVGMEHAGTEFYNFLDTTSKAVLIDQDGFGGFSINGATVAVYIRKR